MTPDPRPLSAEPFEALVRERDANKGHSPAGITMTQAEWDRRWLLGLLDAERARHAALVASARDLYSIAVGEHGHDETHSADWPSCLPAHIAMNRFRAALREDTDE